MTKTMKHPPAPVSRGLSPWQVHRLRIGLRRLACSEPWVDDMIVTRITHIDADGHSICATFFDPRVYPPGGRQTGMRWCRCCGRYTPGPAINLIEHRDSRLGPVRSATLVCDDCRIADDDAQHGELHAAGLHLQPAGSPSVVSRRGMAQNRNSQSTNR